MCIVRRLSVTYGSHYCILCSFDLARQHFVFAFLLFNSMDTLYMYVSVMSEINYYYYYYYIIEKNWGVVQRVVLNRVV